MSIFIQLNSNEILTLNQFAGQKTHRKHTENIVDEINTALYNRDDIATGDTNKSAIMKFGMKGRWTKL